MATGILGGVAGLVTVGVITFVPFVYGLVLGVHVLPGIIAQEVLRKPMVALITHVIAALISSAFTPMWAMRYFGAIQEGVAALTRYRAWGRWRFFVSAGIIGVLVAIVVGVIVDLAQFALWVQLSYLIVSVLGPVVWTAIGIAIGNALRRAGIAPR